MGQRSQIYIRIEQPDKEPILIAKYFQWNYGIGMISRARQIIEFLSNCMGIGISRGDDTIKKLETLMRVNFDGRSIVSNTDILEEFLTYDFKDEFQEYVFFGQDNNDGQLYILFDNVRESGCIKYAFVQDLFSMAPISAAEYFKDYEEEIEEEKEKIAYTQDNIAYINDNAELLSDLEMTFFNDDYLSYRSITAPELWAIPFFKLTLLWNKAQTSKKMRSIQLEDGTIMSRPTNEFLSAIPEETFIISAQESCKRVITELRENEIKSLFNRIIDRILVEMFSKH